VTEQELIAFLDKNQVSFQRLDHPAVFTCEQASRYRGDAPGAGTKNLFLRSEKGDRYLLVATLDHKRIDFNHLGRELGLGKPRFGSPEQMVSLLGVEPGSVTMLALINDTGAKVELYVDRDLQAEPTWQCHPLVNTATLIISRQDMEKFFALTNHPLTWLEIPQKT
jgi:Ala-tRNA(Pro) deacylase